MCDVAGVFGPTEKAEARLIVSIQAQRFLENDEDRSGTLKEERYVSLLRTDIVEAIDLLQRDFGNWDDSNKYCDTHRSRTWIACCEQNVGRHLVPYLLSEHQIARNSNRKV